MTVPLSKYLLTKNGAMKEFSAMQPNSISWLIQEVTQTVEQPIIAVYGAHPCFDAILNASQDALRQQEGLFYVALDVEKEVYHRPEDLAFGLMRQVIDALIEIVREHQEQTRLLAVFRELWNARNYVGMAAPPEQLAEFVQFTEYVCAPMLAEILRSRRIRMYCGVVHAERIPGWLTLLHHFVVEHLLSTLEDAAPKFVIFSNGEAKPPLFYGSDEEGARARVRFLNIGRESGETPQG